MVEGATLRQYLTAVTRARLWRIRHTTDGNDVSAPQGPEHFDQFANAPASYGASSYQPSMSAGGPTAPSPWRRWLPVIAITAIVILGFGTWGIVAATSGSSADPTNYGVTSEEQEQAPDVSELAAQVASAAESVDIGAGVALLCGPPDPDELDKLTELVDDGNSATDGDPKIHNVIQKSDGGQFTIEVSGQGKLDGESGTVRFTVGKSGDRYCVSNVDVLEHS